MSLALREPRASDVPASPCKNLEAAVWARVTQRLNQINDERTSLIPLCESIVYDLQAHELHPFQRCAQDGRRTCLIDGPLGVGSAVDRRLIAQQAGHHRLPRRPRRLAISTSFWDFPERGNG